MIMKLSKSLLIAIIFATLTLTACSNTKVDAEAPVETAVAPAAPAGAAAESKRSEKSSRNEISKLTGFKGQDMRRPGALPGLAWSGLRMLTV